MKCLIFISCLVFLSGCQLNKNNNDVKSSPAIKIDQGKSSDGCQLKDEIRGEGVQWQLLLERNCHYLSSYQLFENPENTRSNANEPGIKFELAIPLFTDYANKYRFVYMPDNQSATYNKFDAFDFPVGTVLAKTFALPESVESGSFSASSYGSSSERAIETRLLIHRKKGWVALPYKWQNENGRQVAKLLLIGEKIPSSIVIDQQTVNFEYEIPSIGQCKTCHLQRQQDPLNLAKTVANFVPIGLKARHLYIMIETSDRGRVNQLDYWQQKSLLKSLPANSQDIQQLPSWQDEIGDDADKLQNKAKGYLDINCAHCHNPKGAGEESGMFLEYWRSPVNSSHGICKRPGGFNGGDLALHYDIVPGDSAASILPYRMSLLARLGDNKGQMPPLSRNINHLEGIELIKKWIDSLAAKDCL